MQIGEFQRLIEQIYFERDSGRGIEGTFRWFVEEVGELARAIGRGDHRQLSEEFADVLAWLTTMSSICGVDLEEACQKYARGCPKCARIPCRCAE